MQLGNVRRNTTAKGETMECKRCHAILMEQPEYEFGEWFIRCLGCNVKNLVAAGLEVVGWRKE